VMPGGVTAAEGSLTPAARRSYWCGNVIHERNLHIIHGVLSLMQPLDGSKQRIRRVVIWGIWMGIMFPPCQVNKEIPIACSDNDEG
jgi:hypothetical protein